MQTTMPPKDQDEWIDTLQSLPDPSHVKEKFESVSHAFNLGGNGPRFMQDLSCSDGKTQPIETLVIGMPGENTLKLNGDFFQKRKTVENLCPACAAMALMTLQINGPPGGVGHRTGLRGAGPLTSVIMGNTLAETLWLNILPRNEFFMGLEAEQKNSIQDIFPWMGPLRTSEGGSAGLSTGISDVSQLQMFWGMGRRILLDTEVMHDTVCSICGEKTQNGISSLKTKPYGIRYDESWRHVLTPYYKSGNDILPVHLQRDGITYRHWLGLVQNDSEGGREIARVVQRFRNIQPLLWGLLPQVPRLWAFGYDFENVKARCWYDSIMPLIYIDESIRERYEIAIAQVIRASDFVKDTLHGAVKDALYSPEKGEKAGKAPLKNQKNPKSFPIVKNRFWSETEPLFYGTADELKKALEAGEAVDAVKRNWIRKVRERALALFDFYSQAQYVDEYRPEAIVAARKRLSLTVSPNAPKLMKLLGLSKEVKT